MCMPWVPIGEKGGDVTFIINLSFPTVNNNQKRMIALVVSTGTAASLFAGGKTTPSVGKLILNTVIQGQYP